MSFKWVSQRARRLGRWTIGFAAAVGVLGASPAWAELIIGVVDYGRLVEESPQAKSALDSIRTEFTPRQRDLQNQQASLKAKEDKLQKDGATMTGDQRTNAEKDLRDGLRKTSYAISTDETRYVLNGVLFSFKENKLTLVATDGRRLAMLDIELEFPRSHEADIIVPTKAVTELQRLLAEDGEVKVSMGSGQIAFDLNNTLLVSKLIEGNYPNYKQVIPSEAKERVTLERETFLNSLRRVSLLASDKSNSIKLNFSKNNIEITANTPEVGEAKESLPVAYKGRDLSIAFNPEFLMAPLRNLIEDEVFLDLIDEMSPGVLKIQTPFLYVLMPMRISA